MMRMTETVKQLLIINIIFYIGSAMTVPMSYELFSLYFPWNEYFQWWQPVTHMFMHAQMPNLMHIFFNMFGLVMFGSALEHFWGWKKFLFFYISCGLGAAIVHSGMNYYEYHQGVVYLESIGYIDQLKTILETGSINFRSQSENIDMEILKRMYEAYHIPAVGASGALYGILVAFAFMFPNAELMLLFIPVPIKAKYFVPGLVAIDLYMGITGASLFGGGGGIAHFAHVGGALFGLLMMWYWKKNQFDRNRWDK